MSALCLNNTLVEQYIKYISHTKFDALKVRNLLKYIHPFLVSKNQHQIFLDPSMLMQISNDPMIHIVNDTDDESLVTSTTLKLQLVDKCNPDSNYTQVNVTPLFATNEKIDMSIGATYENSKEKDKAISHIKALLSDAKWIKVTDKYIQENTSQWDENKKLIETLVPKKSVDIIIVNDGFSKKNELENLCGEWSIKAEKLPINTHDRYIETDKIKILLSSGLYNLSTNSEKDLTYRIKIK